MRFEIGKTFGGYEFIDFLGSSKTDATYKVRNVFAQRIELLRVLPKQDDPDLMGRFLREIKVHARLVHPNIVCFYDAREIEGQLVMTTELVEGNTLAQRLQLGPISWTIAADYMGQTLSALNYAHREGVVHRHITPASIIVTPEGTVKLTSFGLAKAPSDPKLTQAGVVIGDLKYMSPEQVRGAAALDARTDIYSLGAVLYELVTGRAPFDFPSEFDMMLAHVKTMPAAPSAINPDVPRELDAVILTAMAKETSQRFQSADAFRDAIEKTKLAAEKTTTVKTSPEAAPVSAKPQVVSHEEQAQAAPLPAPSNQDNRVGKIASDLVARSCGPVSIDPPFLAGSFISKPGFPDVGTLPFTWGRAQLTVAGIIMAVIVLLAFFTVMR